MQANLLCRARGDRDESIEEGRELPVSARQPQVLILGVDEHHRSIEDPCILAFGMMQQLTRHIRSKIGGMRVHRTPNDDPPQVLTLPVRLQVRVALQSLASEENLVLLLFQDALYMRNPHYMQSLLAQQLVGCCRPCCLDNRIFEQLSHTLL